MYLEAKFEDGAVGFYPVTSSSTITITEPAPNDSSAAPSTTFSAQGIQSVELVDGEIPTLPEHDAPPVSAGTVTFDGSGDVTITSTSPEPVDADGNPLKGSPLEETGPPADQPAA